MANAQKTPVKAVFDVSSSNEDLHETVVRHIGLMAKAYPDSEFELVAYGGAYAMLVDGISTVKSGISEITKMDNVSVVVCQVALEKHGKNKSDLIPGVGSVPDGIYELLLRQQEGWGYIKEMK
ncbi:hypothetical protein SAMN06265367_101598 [Algoriphagus winogradskyi]|uniref:DsrE/DsrF-like family protein n=2 Tax=Algoriphagus winogradskyi TaxID=237017 RepID=A0ABY1NE13_9BACT|nr:hypothetical protein SAMN06265367_101598 [Algoriphagus winogradskyi]